MGAEPAAANSLLGDVGHVSFAGGVAGGVLHAVEEREEAVRPILQGHHDDARRRAGYRHRESGALRLQRAAPEDADSSQVHEHAVREDQQRGFPEGDAFVPVQEPEWRDEERNPDIAPETSPKSAPVLRIGGTAD